MTYEYKCKHCITTFEVQRHVADFTPTVPCPSCGAQAARYFSSERRYDVHFLDHTGWESTGGAY